jgi:hypothetical protein
VTSGISQGGFLAVMAKNYDPRVQAVYALSMSDYAQNAHEPFACVDKQNTSIPANRVTIVNGISDPAFTGQQPVQNVSGFTCPAGSYQCWSPDNSGAGWYIVQNWQVVSGKADHCYFMDGNNASVGCVGIGDPIGCRPRRRTGLSHRTWLGSPVWARHAPGRRTATDRVIAQMRYAPRS